MAKPTAAMLATRASASGAVAHVLEANEQVGQEREPGVVIPYVQCDQVEHHANGQQPIDGGDHLAGRDQVGRPRAQSAFLLVGRPGCSSSVPSGSSAGSFRVASTDSAVSSSRPASDSSAEVHSVERCPAAGESRQAQEEPAAGHLDAREVR